MVKNFDDKRDSTVIDLAYRVNEKWQHWILVVGMQNYGDARRTRSGPSWRRGRSSETADVRERAELRITNANSANLNNEVCYVLEFQFGQ